MTEEVETILSINNYTLTKDAYNKILEVDIDLKKNNKKSFPRQHLFSKLRLPVRIHMLGSCQYCESKIFTFNSDRRGACGYCLKVIHIRSMLKFLVSNRKKNKKLILELLRDNCNKNLYDNKKFEDWSLVIYNFYSKIPSDIVNYMLTFLNI